MPYSQGSASALGVEEWGARLPDLSPSFSSADTPAIIKACLVWTYKSDLFVPPFFFNFWSHKDR